MKLIVDLHIHSKYSRATSKNLDLENIYKWGKLKGIQVIGTGDFTHPGWFEELRSKLRLDEQKGLYELDEQIADKIDREIPASCRKNEMYFVPTVEIANIYKRGGQVRRLHNVVVVPTLEVAAKINARLNRIGNLYSDGRPMLGLDSEELLKIVLDCSPDCLFIPAHIWTPWYAMFGSKSGFDSLEEAFGENKKYIYAVETGLSADPKMCRRLSQLEGVTLVSHSDAHSPGKLGREANILSCESVSYEQLVGAIKSGDGRLVGTIEFYPEEGKYHADGHAKCNFSCKPDETRRLGGICPQCGKPLTIGVLNRVQMLADQNENESEAFNSKIVKYIVPLTEILAEMGMVKSDKSMKVQKKYWEVLDKLGSEFEVLLEIPIEVMEVKGEKKLAEAVEKIRKGEVFVEPGYDGVYGKIKVRRESGVKELRSSENQLEFKY
jgi:uncharacterized protein (TIGR00375 family)